MIEPEQIAGLGIVGGLVWLWLKIQGVFKDDPEPAGPGNSATPGTSAGVDTGGVQRPLTEYEVETLAGLAINFGNRPLNVNIADLMTTAWIESSYRSWAERYEPGLTPPDYSVGLTQTLIRTAQDLYSKGYRDFEYPTRASLKIPSVSMYYGAAYFDWLRRVYPGRDLEWYVRAYNGGPGHNYNSATTAYWNKWSARRRQYMGVS